MGYRDNLDAARARREELVRQLAEVRNGLADRDVLAWRERVLTAELAEVSAQVDHHRSRASLPLLSRVEVASPCPERWDGMAGDDRIRHCGRCEKSVYDLSAMSAAEAEALLEA